MNKKKATPEKTQMIILRSFIIFFVVISAVIAIVKDTFPSFTFIAQMMGVSWGALAGAFIGPFMYGLYSKKITRAACWVSFAFGVGIEVAQLIQMFLALDWSGIPFIGLIFTNSLYSGVFAMIGSLVLVPLVSLFTPKCDKNTVDEIFTCYDKDVTVRVTEALGK